MLYIAGGLLLGLAAGITVAVIRDRRDDKLHGAADLEHSIGAPTLAVVPSTATANGSARAPLASLSLTEVSPAEADAYRTVATKLATPVTGMGARVFLVLRGGASREELAPVNLAATFARQGLATVLVGTDAALRHTRELLGPGEAETPPAGDLAEVADVDGLRLYSLGDELRLDAALRTGQQLVDKLLTEHDIVLLDAVNLELPSSSLTLGRLTRAAVVVAIDGKTSHADVSGAVRELAQVGASPIGGVLFARRGRRIPALTTLLRRRAG
jgi:hypothetical protein